MASSLRLVTLNQNCHRSRGCSAPQEHGMSLAAGMCGFVVVSCLLQAPPPHPAVATRTFSHCSPSTRLLPCFSAGSWGCSALLAASGMTGCSVRDLRLLTYCPLGRHLQRLRVCWVCSIARPAEQRWHLSPGAPSEPSSGVYCDLHCEVR